MSALVLRGVTKRYGDVAAVDRLDLTVEEGALYGFLGPNGAGKTTSIRMALGLVFPTEGEVAVLGEIVTPASDPSPVLARVGAMIEEPAFWSYLTGRRNLQCLARVAGSSQDRKARLARVDEVLEVVGLAEAGDKRVKAYSQGMRQRLGIAQALLGSPELLLLDEPTNGLDPKGMREVRFLLRRLADEGTTVFVSSHLLAEVETMCDRVGVLAHGRLVAEGAPRELSAGALKVRVDVDDVERARRLLAGLHLEVETDLSSNRGGAGRMRVRLRTDIPAATVNRVLVDGGIAVDALVPERDSLEDVFLALVEGEDAPR